ncbi:hypothetical protein D9V41_13195 [Aeromicrobium phragmitis]|uniref:Uncharacterized protein n=1 Tax=Aeromicrobium phragmitis TaxID=2478914 RepID=A0A3L8PI80_9ACTN|nr:hypothetical protein [Aeromicrobium phragmitis]RLV55046.1 hypothetical protein D9V41_13195 [Aeromicrobium phragmitis]
MVGLESATAPAGGAALDQVIGLSVASMVLTVALFAIAWAHRTHRIEWFARAGDALRRRTGEPGWAAFASLFIAGALVVALLGFMWDVSLHAGRGRDEGPLANPAHYLILIGLFALFIAGMIGIVYERDGRRPSRAAVRITRRWFAPVSAVLIAGCGIYALIGFPLDDVWHRLFGQDVTLWGPTHLMLIGGAGLSTAGIVLMHREAQLSEDYDRGSRRTGALHKVTLTCAFGAMLIGLSVFQAEFDFGVAQFRMPFAPMMIALAAAVTFVVARLYAGPGIAIAAALFFLVARGIVSLIVGEVFGQAHHLFPLYLGSAILVELLAMTALRRRPLVFGAVAGLAVGTVGSAIEKLWNDAFFPFPWARDMWAEGLLMTVPVAIFAGMCGALFALGMQGRLPRPTVSRSIYLGAILVLAASIANGLYYTTPKDASARLVIEQVGTAQEPAVEIEMTVEPADLVDEDYTWVQAMAWQGGGPGIVSDNLERTSENTWRSTEPVPIGGNWKTLVRVQDERMLTAVPVYLPADPAIGAEELPVEDTVTREFIREIEILQRERDLGAPMWLWTVGNAVVLVCTLVMLWGIAVAVGRVSRAVRDDTAAPAVPSEAIGR